jgi:hypothetical protein
MSLKKAIATFTTKLGETATRHFSIKTVVFHYSEARVEIIYEIFPSDEARSRGAAPELASQSLQVDFADVDDVQMILAVSDRLWAKVADVPFVDDYSELDQEGKQIGVRRSFQDLNAEIVEVAFA